MALPVGQKLVHIEKSKTKTIKFKNGFPPKVIRSREYFEDFARNGSSEQLQLAETQMPLKKANPTTPQQYAKSGSKKSKDQSQIVDELVLSEKRKGFIPSVTKHGFGKAEKSKRSPFSPPPTMTELRSLTKKIGRFYTVNNGVPSPNRNCKQQKVILDIERALSGKDVSGLEKCYKRIFNGDSAPVRTLVRNQLLPNQRSRQASYPLEIEKVSPSSATSIVSYTRSHNIARKASQRRWSIDSIQNRRLPFVPVPYVRNETRSSPTKSHGLRFTRERPVMFSSSKYDHRQHSKPSAPSTAILTLDPGQFPQLSNNRSQQLDSASLKSGANGTLNSSKKQLIYKSSSIWNQRAPNSTPEPQIRALHDDSESRRNLVPHVATSQFHKSNPHGYRQSDTKRVGIKYDTTSRYSAPQSSNTQDDRREISQVSEDGVVTSAKTDDIEATYNDLNADELHVDEKDKIKSSPEEQVSDLSQQLNASEASGSSAKTTRFADQHSPTNEKQDTEGATGEELNPNSDKDIEGINENELRDAVLEEHTGNVAQIDLEFGDSSVGKEMIETRIADEKMDLKSKLDNVTVVVVNVTTDEGEDVNADIYEYGCKRSDQQGQVQESEESTEGENIATAKAAAKNRKEELEALLKEHSHIVEQIKNLSTDDEE